MAKRPYISENGRHTPAGGGPDTKERPPPKHPPKKKSKSRGYADLARRTLKK